MNQMTVPVLDTKLCYYCQRTNERTEQKLHLKTKRTFGFTLWSCL